MERTMIMTLKSTFLKHTTPLLLAAFTALFLWSGGPAVVNAESQAKLSDISGHWGEEQIRQAVQNGYVTGYTDGTFRPNATITGQEFITMIVKSLQYPLETSAATAEKSWFAIYDETARKNGLYKDDYRSGLDKPLSRGEIASTLVRATQESAYREAIKEVMSDRFSPAALDKSILDFDQIKTRIEASPFFKGELTINLEYPEDTVGRLNQLISDIPSPTDEISWTQSDFDNNRVKSDVGTLLWYIEYGLNPLDKQNAAQLQPKRMIYEAALRGLITGTSPGELSMDAKVTRAQAVTFINRVVAFNDGERFQTNKYTVAAAEVAWHKTNIMTMIPRYFTKQLSDDGFNDQVLSSTSINKQFSCATTALIAIDLEDADDPNRKWLTDDLKWGTSPHLYSLKGVSGYALLSISELTNAPQPTTYFNTCGIFVENEEWYDLRVSTDKPVHAKKPQTTYTIGIVDDKSESRLMPKTIAGSPTSTTTIQVAGYILPKQSDSKNPFTLYYSPVDNIDGGNPLEVIYQTYLDESYE